MRADLSPRGRQANLSRMASEPFDVLVIGGGIVGAAVAWDAALRGLRTALLERGDFAGGTSGKTSRMVHGGLRYLKNLRVRLVRTAVRERDRLLRRAPNLVRHVAFTIPAYRGKGEAPPLLRLGLFVYDALSKEKLLPRREWLRPPQALGREPKLATAGLRAAGVYHDAVVDDARLVLAVLRAAADAGAVVANHAEVLEILRDGDRVSGVRAKDRTTEKAFEVRAEAVVNATGVWTDRLRGGAEGTLRPTKGIHVFLPRDRVGNREAVVLRASRDGRVLFALPWGPLTLVGTTDTDFAGDPNRVVPDADDVAYLLESVNEAFPEARVGPEDVWSAYAGLRPLLRSRARAESDISRAHVVLEDPDGLLSVVGGKLTTMRAMAEDVVDRVARRLGREERTRTREASLGPPPNAREAFLSMGFDAAAAEHLASRHDPEAVRRWLDELQAKQPVAASRPYLGVEVTVAVEEEMAIALEDVMVRRLGLFYELPDQGLAAAPSVAASMAPRLGWDAGRVRREVDAYGALIAEHRSFRRAHGR